MNDTHAISGAPITRDRHCCGENDIKCIVAAMIIRSIIIATPLTLTGNAFGEADTTHKIVIDAYIDRKKFGEDDINRSAAAFTASTTVTAARIASIFLFWVWAILIVCLQIYICTCNGVCVYV